MVDRPFFEDSVIKRAVESQDASLVAQALEEITNLLNKKSPTDEEHQYLLFSRASCYRILGDFANARHALRLALQDRPDSAETKATYDFMQGLILHAEAKYEEAFRQFSTCIAKHGFAKPELKDIREDIQTRRAFLAVTLSQFEQAIPLLEQCLSFDLDQKVRGDALAALGLCYLERKDWSTARDHFSNAIREGLDSYAASVHFYLGIAYYYCGMLRESKREFLICEQQSPSNEVPLLDLYVWLSSVCSLLEETAESSKYARLSRPS